MSRTEVYVTELVSNKDAKRLAIRWGSSLKPRATPIAKLLLGRKADGRRDFCHVCAVGRGTSFRGSFEGGHRWSCGPFGKNGKCDGRVGESKGEASFGFIENLSVICQGSKVTTGAIDFENIKHGSRNIAGVPDMHALAESVDKCRSFIRTGKLADEAPS